MINLRKVGGRKAVTKVKQDSLGSKPESRRAGTVHRFSRLEDLQGPMSKLPSKASSDRYLKSGISLECAVGLRLVEDLNT